MTDRVTIYDTTLRDGCQGTGISLSLHDKLSIARRLDEFGVAVRASYTHHLPMSTSILAFHKLAQDEAGEPALILERHGSLGVDLVEALARRHGFSLVLGEKAHERLPLRDDIAVEA
jgi:hypothetical protein